MYLPSLFQVTIHKVFNMIAIIDYGMGNLRSVQKRFESSASMRW